MTQTLLNFDRVICTRPRFTARAKLCEFCDGSGWRQVFVRGERRVTRCDHKPPRELVVIDQKSLAGGDR